MLEETDRSITIEPCCGDYFNVHYVKSSILFKSFTRHLVKLEH